MRRSWLAVALLLVVLAGSVVLGVRFGSVPLSTGEILRAVSGQADAPYHHTIVVDFRLPRALLAVLVGGSLALAGATFQAILRNPLAEPYILGISGGASVGAVLVLALGLASESWALPVAAFAGALVAIVLVFRVATAAGRAMDVRVLLLAGVVVGAFFSACIAFILAVSDARTVQSAVLWIMGSLAGADWRDVAVTAAYSLPAGLVLLTLARPLNLMAIGEETAQYLGTDVEKVKRLSLGVAALLTAAGVAVAGVIGFVGLVVPHAVRLLVGSDHRILLPLSFLAGAAFLTLADLVARMMLAPAEVPIGVITAFVGVPFFLLLLRRSMSA